MKRGDLILSKAHIPEAQGPYVVIHEMESYVIAVSLDNKFSLNIQKELAIPCNISILNSGTDLARQLAK